jgi:alcohol dehydrogenase
MHGLEPLALSPLLTPFDWQPATRLLYGPGVVVELGPVTATHGRRALVVTDPGVVAAGHLGAARASLEASGVVVAVFDGTRENPTTDDVDACVAAARDAGADVLVGFGGGSSIDTAKGANFLLTNGGRMEDYWHAGNPDARAPSAPFLPLVAVPTTAGTGSEVQSHTLIADARTHRKMAIGDPKAAPVTALLDPLLTVTLPPRVTACTGIDALVHAVETAVTLRRTPLSLLYSREAFRLLTAHFPTVLHAPGDVEARGGVLLGAAYAGIAIENSMLGAAHSCANPLTARFDVVHGQAVGVMLPHVVRHNAADPTARAAYAELAAFVPGLPPTPVALADHLHALLTLSGLRTSLRPLGVTEDALPALAEDAARQWTARFNPRPVATEDFLSLYRAAL